MSVDTSGGHSEMDYPEHERTYNGFIRWSVIATVAIIGTLGLMAIFLV